MNWNIRHRPIQYLCVFACFILAFSSALMKSATVDETAIAANGFILLKTGDFSIDSRSAPLPKILTGLPLVLAHVEHDSSKQSKYNTCWEYANEFQYANAGSFHFLIMLSRLPSILSLCLTCLLAIIFARRLYGDKAATVTAVLACFSPILIAYGSLSTSDIYFTASLTGLLLVIDVYASKLNYKYAFIIGIMLGVSCLSKFTGILLLPLIPFLLIPAFLTMEKRKQIIPHLIVIYLSCLLTINAGFGFNKVFLDLSAYDFSTDLFKKIAVIMPAIPLPVPYHFLYGIDSQLAETGYTAYLSGEFSNSSFPQYYMIALLIKTPLPFLLLTLTALVVRPLPGRRETPLITAAIFLLAYLSLAGHKNIGVRYIMFLLPIMSIITARLIFIAESFIKTERKKLVNIASAILVTAVMIETCLIWPDYIPYFNQITGGSKNGHNWLLDSNLDWGQDLITLRRFMEKNHIDKIDLAYYGRVSPGIYRISYDHLFQGRKNRYAAISANLLWGNTYFINATDFWPTDRNYFAEFRKIKPCTILGHTIYIYDLGPLPGN